MNFHTYPALQNYAEVKRMLETHGGVNAVAAALGCNRKTVRKALKKHGLKSSNTGGRPRKYPGSTLEVLRQAESLPELQAVITQEKAKIREEWQRQLLSDLRKKQALNEMIIEALQGALSQIEYSPAPIFTKVLNPSELHEQEEETAVLVLSDTQIGQITPSYDSEIFIQELDRLAQVTEKITNLHRVNYRINELAVFMAGDIIENETLFPGQGFCIDQSVLKQIFHTGIPAFARFFQHMSSIFTKVTVYCVPGNHGRVSKHNAPDSNWDRVFYLTLDLALEHSLKNVKFVHAELQDFYLVADVKGYKFLIVHGDEIPIWMNIPYYGIERSSSRWAQSIPRGPWEYLVMGHFHQSAWLKSNAKKIIMNGAFPTDSPYVLKKLKLDSTEAVQWLFGVHDRGISWRYEIDLTPQEVV